MRAPNFAVLVSAGLLACDSPNVPAPVYEFHLTAEMLTGAALAALRADGRLNLESPVTAPGQVSQQEAKDQSPQFARYVTNQLLLRGVVEGERGGFWTDPHLLTTCRDTYYVHSQLGSTVSDTAAAGAMQSSQRRFGPQWIVPMCGAEDDPQMTVQVAVNGNDIRFADGSPIQPYVSLSTAWHARGVPLYWPDALTVSAERVVRFVWETFGVRVSEVPQLFFRGSVSTSGIYSWYQVGSVRFCNRWRVTLENDVIVRGTTSLEEITTRELWLAALSCSQRDVEPWIHLPLSAQPSEVTLDYFDDAFVPSKRWTYQVPVVAPVAFEIGMRVR